MPDQARSILCKFLEDAIAAEKAFESQFRSFVGHGADDTEVETLFAVHATRTAAHIAALSEHLESLGGSPSVAKNVVAVSFGLAPKLAQWGHLPEEKLAQNLIVAYSIEMGERAMCASLVAVAQLAGDVKAAEIATAIGEEATQMAEEFFRFISTRSKIAFNMATAGELDPAIDTKAPDDRLI